MPPAMEAQSPNHWTAREAPWALLYHAQFWAASPWEVSEGCSEKGTCVQTPVGSDLDSRGTAFSCEGTASWRTLQREPVGCVEGRRLLRPVQSQRVWERQTTPDRDSALRAMEGLGRTASGFHLHQPDCCTESR